MIGVLKGIKDIKGISLNIKSIRVKQGGSGIRFWDKNKRKKFYYLKIFWGETHNGVIRLYI